MKNIRTISLLSLLFLARFVFSAPAPQELTGQWYTEKKQAYFEFYQEAQEFRARMYPIEKPEMIDSNNPVDSLKNRKLYGVTTIWGLIYNHEKRQFEGGSVYNPENGKIYKCHCRLSDDGKSLRFRGYLGVSALGQTRVWTRKE